MDRSHIRLDTEEKVIPLLPGRYQGIGYQQHSHNGFFLIGYSKGTLRAENGFKFFKNEAFLPAHRQRSKAFYIFGRLLKLAGLS